MTLPFLGRSSSLSDQVAYDTLLTRWERLAANRSEAS